MALTVTRLLVPKGAAALTSGSLLQKVRNGRTAPVRLVPARNEPVPVLEGRAIAASRRCSVGHNVSDRQPSV